MNIYIAKSHPAEYLIHKYWARKPHNVVSSFIKKYSQKEKIVLDPFCGSCVTNIEAAKLGFNTIGIDINPIAILIGKVSLTKLSLSQAKDIFEDLFFEFKGALSKYYTVNNNLIRYCVHEAILSCSKCKNLFPATDENKKGKRFLCNECGKLMNCNASTIRSSRIISLITIDNDVITDDNILNNQTVMSNNDFSEELGTDISTYTSQMFENRRILTYKKVLSNRYFTSRNFCSLSFMADRIHNIRETDLKNLFLLCLTSCVAQCSRLIPSRNDLTTGGPAWSVPGFWIPRIHLECNPIIHFEARFNKIMRALQTLSYKINKPFDAKFFTAPTKEAYRYLKNIKIGYVFADPPYGDSVPYLEFSNLWNPWLLKKPKFNSEIVVSDCKDRKKDWKQYEIDVMGAVKTISGFLEEETYFTFTFNQLFLEAWKALLNCTEKSGLQFHDIALVLPAVIPSKARFSVKGSYVGDYYITFKKTNNYSKNTIDIYEFMGELTKAYNNVCSPRKGILSYPQIIRIAIGLIFKKKCPSHFTDIANEFIKENFIVKDEPFYYYKHFERVKRNTIDDEIDSLIIEFLNNGPRSLWHIVKFVLEKYEFIQAPEIYEIISRIDIIAMKKDKKYSLKESKQLSLF